MPRKAVVGRKLLLDVVTVLGVNKTSGKKIYMQFKLYHPPKDKDKVLQRIREKNKNPDIHISYITTQHKQFFKCEMSPEEFVEHAHLTPLENTEENEENVENGNYQQIKRTL